MRPDFISAWSQSISFFLLSCSSGRWSNYTQLFLGSMPVKSCLAVLSRLPKAWAPGIPWAPVSVGLNCLSWSSFTYLKRLEVIPLTFLQFHPQNTQSYALPWDPVSDLSVSKPSKLAMPLAQWHPHVPLCSGTRELLTVFRLLGSGSCNVLPNKLLKL